MIHDYIWPSPPDKVWTCSCSSAIRGRLILLVNVNSAAYGRCQSVDLRRHKQFFSGYPAHEKPYPAGFPSATPRHHIASPRRRTTVTTGNTVRGIICGIPQGLRCRTIQNICRSVSEFLTECDHIKLTAALRSPVGILADDIKRHLTEYLIYIKTARPEPIIQSLT